MVEVEDDGPVSSMLGNSQCWSRSCAVTTHMDGATGFGLGSSIARAVARAHGGDLTLHDRPGGGLIARFELPRHGTGAREIAAPLADV